MDFSSLNRRELQYLCKLNKIPANITNIAMADALNSLETVVGIEEMLDHFRSETAGEANELLKTPALTSKTAVKMETNTQRVYNTRRSTRLTEKKCTETGVTEREISQPVKIASFLDEVSVISEKNVDSETSHESNISIKNTEDSVHEETGENCDEVISNEKVEDICIEFKKLDVVTVDETNENSVIEKVDYNNENVDLEDKHEDENKFILDSVSSDVVSDVKNGIDIHEALNVSIKEDNVYVAPEAEVSNPIELSKLDNAELEGIKENISTNIVENDIIINKKAEDEKPKSLHDSSLRQLKKQLKALTIKSNMNTDNDDMVVEARSVLPVVCDNNLINGNDN